jgi:broad-specificity NMP kinase
MPIVYVTGVEGSGKSTICDALVQSGYEAMDFDQEGLSTRYIKGSWKQTDNLPAPGEDSYE